MRRVVMRALGSYPLVDPALWFVADEDNTTFRADATAPDGRDRFLLRVHRPARHGRNVDSAATIGSELVWLTALRAGTDLLVPVPFRTVDGKLTTVAASPGVPEPRVCSVLRWMDGRIHSAASRLVHLSEGADNFGLIRTDLHLGNALFWRGEVRVIDFDDCGFGYWLYDITVALWELRYRNDYEDFRSALIEGYTQTGRCRPATSPISMTSSLPAESQSACGSPKRRSSTPSSAPNSTRYRKTSATLNTLLRN
jgi:Ser/Thr protein kinase RdoA (MazF antagonist)